MDVHNIETDIYNYDITARSSAQILTKAEQLIR